MNLGRCPVEQDFHSKRKEALEWWNNLTHAEKHVETIRYFDLYNQKRLYNSLTGREIENIYKMKILY
jgi:hypothetical protein